MQHDAWFFIGVFVFIFVIWMATGGPLRPLSLAGPTLAQPEELGGGTYMQLPRALFGIGNSKVSLPGSSSNYNSGNQNSVTSIPSSIPSLIGGITFGTPSPYREIVRMSHSISGIGSVNPGNEYLDIYIPQNAGVPVNISEWRLVSEATGNAATVPKGTEIPISGIVNASQQIVLTPGTRAILISGQSPIGASFRENKCIGYFSTFQTFSPSLPQNCPVPSDELLASYGPNYIRDSVCIERVKKIPRCQISFSLPQDSTSACQSFVVKYLNYNGCVEAHKNDPDIMGNTWRVYLGRTN